LAGFAVAILNRKSDALWGVWLVYGATGLFIAAVALTLFGISLIGDHKKS
jgi:hypothetical protein